MSNVRTKAVSISRAMDNVLVSCAGLMDRELDECWEAAVNAGVFARLERKNPGLFVSELVSDASKLNDSVQSAIKKASENRDYAYANISVKCPELHRQIIDARRWDALFNALNAVQEKCWILLADAKALA